MAPYMEKFIDPLLDCFLDPENRIRYFSAECLYNIAKVSKGEILVYFNAIFDGLSKVRIRRIFVSVAVNYPDILAFLARSGPGAICQERGGAVGPSSQRHRCRDCLCLCSSICRSREGASTSRPNPKYGHFGALPGRRERIWRSKTNGVLAICIYTITQRANKSHESIHEEFLGLVDHGTRFSARVGAHYLFAGFLGRSPVRS